MWFDKQVEKLEERRLLAGSPWVPAGVGAIGDSYADEYQFYPPDKINARSFVELLAEERGLDFGQFTTVSRPAPRNAGYEYNWGLDGARTADLPAQVAGLAAQMSAEQVELGLIFIGGNDFRDVFISPDPVAALPVAVQNAATNITWAVQTLLAADPDVKLALSNVPNIGNLPEIQFYVSAGFVPQALVDAVDTGIDALNQHIGQIASSSDRVALVDVDGLMESIFGGRKFKVAGVSISRSVPGNDPTHLFLADGLHAGTVGHALLSNLFIDAMNELGMKVKRFNPPAILREAGIARASESVRQNLTGSSPFSTRPIAVAVVGGLAEEASVLA